jgi:hypothetical protein
MNRIDVQGNRELHDAIRDSQLFAELSLPTDESVRPFPSPVNYPLQLLQCWPLVGIC